MQKFIFIMLCWLISMSILSQKVKIKKNIISIDDIEVGRVEKFKNKETKKEGYIYSDLNGENSFIMDKYPLDNQNLWFVLKPSFASDTAEIEMEYLYLTLSEQNALTDLLVKRYHFFNTTGLNIKAIKDYVQVERDPQIEPLRERLIAEKKKRLEIDRMHIRVLEGGTIVRGGGDEPIGKFLSPRFDQPIHAKNPIIILDEQGNELAKITDFSSSSRCIITTYDDNMFTYEDSGFFRPERANEFYTGIAKFLALKGYMKGQPNSFVNVIIPQMEAAKAKEAELTAQEKEEYIKRTHIEGTLTLKKGETYTGKFEVLFRQTELGSIQNLSRVYDQSRLGWGLLYFYTNRYGKPDTHYFRSGKCIKFEVDPEYTYNGEPEIYDVINYSIISDNSPLNFNKLIPFTASETFVLRKIATPKIGLYYYSGYFILKRTDKKRGYAKKEFTPSDLKEFASNAPQVIANIDSGVYANGYNGLVKFVEDYTRYAE